MRYNEVTNEATYSPEVEKRLEPYKNYKMTYVKIYPDGKREKILTTLDISDGVAPTILDPSNYRLYPESVVRLVKNNPKHKEIIAKGFRTENYGKHNEQDTHYGEPIKIIKI